MQTRNNEKYSKNKERNRQREIDLERSKIRMEAVKQAEHLAAKHDPSGKLFNIGEVVIFENGTAKSKERMRIEDELKAQREKDKKVAEEVRQVALELKETKKAARAKGLDLSTALQGISSERLAQIQGAKIMSNTQKRKQAMYAPKPVPPKPVLPEGISLPEGEENMIALWDITDEDVVRRLAGIKRKKKQQRAAFRKQQRKEKIFRRAMKSKKKQAINRGEDFDPEQAAKEILEEQRLRESKPKSKFKTTSDDESESLDSDSDFDSISDSDSSSESGSEAETNGAKAKTRSEGTSELKKRPNSDATNGDNMISEEPKAKKGKKSKESTSADSKEDETAIIAGTDESSKEKIREENKLTPARSSNLHPTPEAIRKIVQKEKERAKRAKKRQEKVAKTLEEAEKPQSKQKKRKRSKEQEEDGPGEETRPEKSHKKKAKLEDTSAAPAKPTSGAEQWNPDALTGDETRKAKFLRLLGAGKSNGVTSTSKHKSQADSTAISKVQSDLEKQYEAGMKLKHDGGSKRRGIGA
jgi:hypothetical protein